MVKGVFFCLGPISNTNIPQDSHSAKAVYNLGISGTALPIITKSPLPNK